jgi:hypothetical protein
MAQESGLELWGKIHAVFSHPRCANCHVGPDHVPIWSGKSYGPVPRPHGMNINGGAKRSGEEHLACSACHTRQNSVLPHGPPGAHVWKLPPVEMQWFDKSSAQICAQIKDKALNGNRTIEQVAHHIEDDALVAWGWEPGPGREPAPHSAAQVAAFLRAWERAGAPCPAD